jgi:L-idonate 5-dehydrogenase
LSSNRHPARLTSTRALVAHSAGDVRVERIPLESPAADEAIIRVAYGGICGSDLHYWKHGAAGQSILREPMVLGHEVVGVVERAADDGDGPAKGMAVAVHPARYGSSPQRYPESRPNISAAVSYLGSAAQLPHTPGAFAEHVVLPVGMLRVLPAELSLRTAALLEPASVAWHAVSRAGNVAGRKVMVIGTGPIGALIVAVARARGAAEVTAVDVHPRPLEIAKKLGAARTILASDESALATADPDIVLESSGSPRGLSTAISAATRGGRVVLVGLLPDGDLPVPIATAITRELDLVGSFRFHDEMTSVIEAMALGQLHVEPVITHQFPLERALVALETAADSAISGKVLLSFS